MTIQREEPSSSGLGKSAAIVSVLLFALAGGAMLYRSSGSAAKATRLSSAKTEPVSTSSEPPRVSRKLPRVVDTTESVTREVTPPSASPPAASPAAPETENAGMQQPFVEARREQRDTVWAIQMESSIREAMVQLSERKVTLESVQCASIRCTVEGTIGRGGRLEDVATAVGKIGLTRGRFKHAREGDGTMTFSAVVARKGYAIDGSTVEVAANAEALRSSF